LKFKPKLVHRWVVEQHIGRELDSSEIVHHKDRNKVNNKISNLTILSRAEHTRLHMFGKKASKESLEKAKRTRIERGTSFVGLKNPFYGKKHTPETRIKMSLAAQKRKARVLSEETKKKIGLANSGKESNRKGKSWEEIFGIEKAKQMKKRIRH